HQMWAAQYIDRERPRTFITSGGLGTMGFGFPAALGAAIACPEKQVVCVAGDGSFQMNIQEMATAAVHRIPVKVVLMDNRCLGMVHQWQKLFCDQRYAATLLDPVPDFVAVAKAYGWQARRIERSCDVSDALAEMLASPGPYLLDVAISRDQDVYPMVAPGTGLEDAIGAIDVAVGAVRTGMPQQSAGAEKES
ncbi:MAG TPA: acetolactate synthase large subunit, partial [Candidatus Aphodovivens excrementavium]|nr:acetolactate synthase large subunit [Candidatus Aphodovivens excrementavium]